MSSSRGIEAECCKILSGFCQCLHIYLNRWSRTGESESSPLFQPFAETTGRGILVLYSLQTEAPFYKLPYTKSTRTLRDVITNH